MSISYQSDVTNSLLPLKITILTIRQNDIFSRTDY
jgi:hypothetical protein